MQVEGATATTTTTDEPLGSSAHSPLASGSGQGAEQVKQSKQAAAMGLRVSTPAGQPSKQAAGAGPGPGPDLGLGDTETAARRAPGQKSLRKAQSASAPPPKPKARQAGQSSATETNEEQLRASGQSRQHKEQIVQQQAAGAATMASEHASRAPRPKTTRVRINSTSEQIQDPNWLIRMSKELEQQEQQSPVSKRSHLKSLHRRLKSTITGSHQSSKSSDEPSADSALAGAEQAAELLAPAKQVSANSTPVKVPVSILKQRPPDRPRAQTPNPARKSASLARPSSTAPTQPPSSSSHQQPTAQQQVSRPSSKPRSGGRPASANAIAAPNTSQSRRPSPVQVQAQSEPSPAQSSKQAVPICADGQVKVSGWKRNNLLAKTLSHLDEIRGNQRPVFVPTKIRLPSETAAQRSADSKFADVVRLAMAKKRQAQLDQSPAPKRLSNCDSAPEEILADARSASAAPRPTSPPTNQQQQPAQQAQHRSSSAGLPGSAASKQQPVIKTTSPRTPRPPQLAVSALSQPQLMNQLLNVSAQQSSALLESGSSSRQFKLQQKNHQVLQNLRRQSNELQASLHAASLLGSAAATGPGGSLSAASSPAANNPHSQHRKDWKRLTGKLALLTSGHQSRKHHHLFAASADHSPPSSLQVSQSPLRLTVSNQETGSGGRQKRGSGSQLQVPGASFVARKEAQGDRRKLSSSSMVVQPVTGEQAASAGFSLAEQQLRRSSDSGAYTSPAAGTSAGFVRKNSSSTAVQVAARQPVVVCRDDLLHLLKVTGCGSDESSQQAGDDEMRRRSLQLNSDRVPLESLADPHHQQQQPARSNSTGSLDNAVLPNEGDKAEWPDENEAAARNKRKTDLSWVVKKTSKVVFFHEKLRKMRWTLKQQQEQVPKQSEPEPDKLADANSGCKSASTFQSDVPAPAPQHQHQTKADVFMDPTLIGDAIEIFLRSTMQQQQQQQTKPPEAGPASGAIGRRSAEAGSDGLAAPSDGHQSTGEGMLG